MFSAAAGPAWEPTSPRALGLGSAPCLLSGGGGAFPQRTTAEPRPKQCHSALALVINGGRLGTKWTLSPSSLCVLLGLTTSKGGSTDRRPEEARLQPALAGKGREASAAAAGPVEPRETLGLISRERGRAGNTSLGLRWAAQG